MLCLITSFLMILYLQLPTRTTEFDVCMYPLTALRNADKSMPAAIHNMAKSMPAAMRNLIKSKPAVVRSLAKSHAC